MNKKNFIIDYTMFDRRGHLIRSGAVRSSNQVNSEQATIGTVGFLKGAYPHAKKIVVHGCKEEERQPRKQAIVVIISVGAIAV